MKIYQGYDVRIYVCDVYVYKEFCVGGSKPKQCYIADIEPDKAVIEPETCEQCYIG